MHTIKQTLLCYVRLYDRTTSITTTGALATFYCTDMKTETTSLPSYVSVTLQSILARATGRMQ